MMGLNETIERDSELTQNNCLPLIKEYESIIEALTTQVDFYASEQENLRKEITTLVTENQLLGLKVNELLNSRTDISKETKQNRSEIELTENLKSQLNLTLTEKDTVVELWQNALKNIDHLEEELKLFEGRTHGYYSKTEVVKLKQKYGKQITELEEQLTNYHSKLDIILKESAKSIEIKNLDLKTALESQENTSSVVKHLENEVKQLQSKLKQIMAMRDELQITLDAKNDLIEELKIKDFQAKAKVTEAIQIVEAAFFEKDAALLRENDAKDEVLKISKTLSEVIDEAAEKVKNEIENVKQEHDVKLNKTQQNMKNLQDEITANNIQLEKYFRECKLLEEELERVKKGNICIDDSNTSKLLILEKNLESTFQKLLLSERKCLQVTSEKECVKCDLEQMATCYQNDVKTREVEKHVLKHEIQSLKNQLKNSNRNLIQVAGEVEKMNAKVKLLDVEIKDKLQAKDLMHELALAQAVEEVQKKNTKVQKELQIFLELQIAVNKKWKKEMYDILDKFENQKKELKEANKGLRAKLKQAISDTRHYKSSLTDICTNVTNIANVNKDTTNKK